MTLFSSRKHSGTFGGSLNAANSLFFTQEMNVKLIELSNISPIVCLMLIAGKEQDKHVLRASQLLESIKLYRDGLASISEGLPSDKIRKQINAHLKKQDEMVKLIELSFSSAKQQAIPRLSTAKDRPLADFLKGPIANSGNQNPRQPLKR